ncbi:MAG: PepSY-associated TM helix domain-containing protein [Candidatus Marinimicrobia bacterium]|nr:PepSY-associated TM helix domain-containing protein [Candidatus Neomarinimicrobiota bacterium]
MKWRKWNNILHRDIGYLAVGLTIIYSVSGLAVNHVADWNPSYIIEKTSFQIDVSSFQSPPSESDISQIISASNLNGSVKSTFMADPDQIRIFLENQSLDLNLKTGNAELESIKKRAFLQEFNAMHLNHPKKLWTWMADIYAVVLIVLAITGLFVLKGKKGITGRGAWLTSLGILIPLLFYFLYF